MQFLTADEAFEWCRTNEFPLEAIDDYPAPPMGSSFRFAIPTDAGKRVALATALWESVALSTSEVLVWVTFAGAWPSGECRPLAEAARSAWGATETLNEQPGHLVRIGESEEGLSLLVLATLFLWDCWILPIASNHALFVSHDEYAVAYGRSQSDLDGLIRKIGVLGVQAQPDAG